MKSSYIPLIQLLLMQVLDRIMEYLSKLINLHKHINIHYRFYFDFINFLQISFYYCFLRIHILLKYHILNFSSLWQLFSCISWFWRVPLCNILQFGSVGWCSWLDWGCGFLHGYLGLHNIKVNCWWPDLDNLFQVSVC